MSEKPKRKFCQFHLLTLVLMALATGGIMCPNIKHSPRFTDHSATSEDEIPRARTRWGGFPSRTQPQSLTADESPSFTQGWPIVVYEYLNDRDRFRIANPVFTPIGEDEETTKLSTTVPTPSTPPWYSRTWEWLREYAPVIADGIFGMICLFATWQISESIIRRREARKT
jgi:hypothetical protein